MRGAAFKQLFSWLFLGLFLYASIGSQAVVWVWKWQAQERLEELALLGDVSNLVCIDAQNSGEEEQEINLNGHWFDVVKTTFVKGKKVLLCVQDITEENLLSSAANDLGNVFHQQFNSLLKFSKKVVSQTYESSTCITYHLQQIGFDKVYFIRSFFLLTKTYINVLVQPPEGN